MQKPLRSMTMLALHSVVRTEFRSALKMAPTFARSEFLTLALATPQTTVSLKVQWVWAT